MTMSSKWKSVSGLSGILTIVCGMMAVAAQAVEISDKGAFFSAAAIARANQSIQEIEQKSRHEIRIETFASVPDDGIESVSKMNATQRGEFFSKWVSERAEATKSRGIVILICREPSHFNVWAGTPIQRAGFGASQAKAVRETLAASLKAKDFDKALLDGVAQLSKTVEGLSPVKPGTSLATHERKQGHTNAPAASNRIPINRNSSTGPTQSSWSGVLMILMFVVGGVLLISLLGRLFGGGGRGSAGGNFGRPGYGGGGGGGFMSGLTGGIFGAVAGNWLYDQFSGHHASAGQSNSMGDSFGSNESSGGGMLDSGADSADTGYSGGTDFGGGDFGGGDFGDGDF